MDARALEADFDPGFDVCVIGAGPAGVAMACSLSGRGLRIVLLEAGGSTPTLAGQKMMAATQTGSNYWPVENSRYLAVGGSANRWGGISRPLDELDFEPRPWVDQSGWPMSYEGMKADFAASAAFLDLPSDRFTPPVATADGSVLAFDDEDFSSIGYQLSPLIHFGRTILPKLLAAQDVTVISNAFVTELTPWPDSDLIESVSVRTLTGSSFTLRPKVVALCAGAIENARLLLMSRSRRAAGLANAHDVVGRYFMEHLHAPIGHLHATPKAARWSTYDLSNPAQPRMRAALTPTPFAAREHELLSATLAIGPASYAATPPFISWLHPLTLLLERAQFAMEDRGGRTADVADRVLNLARSGWGELATVASRRRMRESAGVDRAGLASLKSIYVRAEQAPLASNRVTLEDRVDQLGRPRAALHWQVDEQSVRSAERVLTLFAGLAERHALGPVTGPYDGWQDAIVGGPHHMGTTRMAESPRNGVVDGEGRAHGLDNLFISGSSLFPTGGHVNPTFTLVALTIRVADAVARCALADRVITPSTAGAVS